MENNRYFKGTGQITLDIEKFIVGDRLSQREVSKLGTKIIKLYLGDTEKRECLKNWVEIFDIDAELEKDEWKNVDFLNFVTKP
jgi:hypothetical protein